MSSFSETEEKKVKKFLIRNDILSLKGAYKKAYHPYSIKQLSRWVKLPQYKVRDILESFKVGLTKEGRVRTKNYGETQYGFLLTREKSKWEWRAMPLSQRKKFSPKVDYINPKGHINNVKKKRYLERIYENLIPEKEYETKENNVLIYDVLFYYVCQVQVYYDDSLLNEYETGHYVHHKFLQNGNPYMTYGEFMQNPFYYGDILHDEFDKGTNGGQVRHTVLFKEIAKIYDKKPMTLTGQKELEIATTPQSSVEDLLFGQNGNGNGNGNGFI